MERVAGRQGLENLLRSQHYRPPRNRRIPWFPSRVHEGVLVSLLLLRALAPATSSSTLEEEREMQQFQPAPVGAPDAVPTATDRALRAVFASIFFAITIASIAFSIAASGRPSRELTTAMCAALAAWQMAGYSRSCARTTSRLWPRALEWTGIACAIISIGAAVTSVITSNGGGYDYFSIPSRVANGALLGTLCCLIALLVLKYRTRDIHA